MQLGRGFGENRESLKQVNKYDEEQKGSSLRKAEIFNYI